MSAADNTGRLRFLYFTSATPAGPPNVPWRSPESRNFNYLDLADWTRLVTELERAKFDAVFWADHSAPHDKYKGSWEETARNAVQFPIADPMLLTAGLASSTSDLGFVFSSNIIQAQPFHFARQLTTLDHFTRGRIGWNIVTSFQPTAWRNLGRGALAGHGARYQEAEEYVQVIYKLLEGSWEDGAVLRDVEANVYADPARVHAVDHQGEHYHVDTIHPLEPSPQRLPLLFQAGSSDDGRDFSSRNAEAIFVATNTPQGVSVGIEDVNRRLKAQGRLDTDLMFAMSEKYVVGSTEEEARRKAAEIDKWLSSESLLVNCSSMFGVDLSTADLDTPVKDLDTQSLQGLFKTLAEKAPDKSVTLRDAVSAMFNLHFAGTPDQIADRLEALRDAGVRAINLGSARGWEDVFEFTEHVVPVLQKRGLMQKDYVPGTLREKFFSGTPSASGPLVNERHPAARYRR